MPPVKGHDPSPKLPARIRLIRKVLGWPRKPLTQAELHAELRRKFAEQAPSLSTVKRWEQKAYGRISGDDAGLLAEISGASLTWVLTGQGVPPALRELPGTIREPEAQYKTKRRPGARAPRDAESGAALPGDGEIDLLEEIVRHPERFAMRLQDATATIGVEAVLAWLEDVEQICRERGHDFQRFFANLRARLRGGAAAASGAHA